MLTQHQDAVGWLADEAVGTAFGSEHRGSSVGDLTLLEFRFHRVQALGFTAID